MAGGSSWQEAAHGSMQEEWKKHKTGKYCEVQGNKETLPLLVNPVSHTPSNTGTLSSNPVSKTHQSRTVKDRVCSTVLLS